MIRAYELPEGKLAALTGATTPRARLGAVVRAGFQSDQFQGHVISAWLNFYVQAQTVPEAQRLLTIYQRRLRSNLVHDLKPLVGHRASVQAETLAALIDGVYIRAALADGPTDAGAAAGRVLETLDLMIGEVT